LYVEAAEKSIFQQILDEEMVRGFPRHFVFTFVSIRAGNRPAQ